MVVFDSTLLLPMLWPEVPAPVDPLTKNPVENLRERVDFLIQRLEKNRTKIIIPTPALSEILVRAGRAGPQYLAQINSTAVFRTAPFDERAAVEVAAMTRSALDGGDKRGGAEGTWAKVKYDRQIVAIAKVQGATTIYSDDIGVQRLGNGIGLTVVRLFELPLPPEDPQTSLDLGGKGPVDTTET